MASAEAHQQDPLLALRHAVSIKTLPIPTTSADAISAAEAESNLARATHLQFNNGSHKTFPLTTPTRFISNGTPIDLRSIYFAYQKKDDSVNDYITATQRLNDELALPGAAGGRVQNLVFIEKLDLINWLEGGSDESEYIKPLANDAAAAQAAGAADVASGAVGGVATVPSGALGAKGPKAIDERLIDIYNGERKMGDRNSVLRGIKPTDFSHIRKYAATFLKHSRHQPPNAPNSRLNTASNPALVSSLKKPTHARRIEPIILLSPSASSLLRMSNIKGFLDTGVFQPADQAGSGVAPNLLQLTRILPQVDSTRPLRFIIVDSPDQFKPDYWQRVVAVFTTGQTWQFKNYKWTQPAELFSHTLGIYVGWRGEDVPAVVKGWGHRVLTVMLDSWNPKQGAQGRWRDREVVEQIWSAVEENMKARGWTKDGLPGAGGR